MPRKASVAILAWLVIGALVVISFASRMPDCETDPSAALCDRVAAIAFGAPYLIAGIVWSLILVILTGALLLGWIRAAPRRAP